MNLQENLGQKHAGDGLSAVSTVSAGIQGVKVGLGRNPPGTTSRPIPTGAGGSVEFKGLEPGNYFIVLDPAEPSKPGTEKLEDHRIKLTKPEAKAAADMGPRGKPPLEANRPSGQATVCPHGGAPAGCAKCREAAEARQAPKTAGEQAKPVSPMSK